MLFFKETLLLFCFFQNSGEFVKLFETFNTFFSRRQEFTVFTLATIKLWQQKHNLGNTDSTSCLFHQILELQNLIFKQDNDKHILDVSSISSQNTKSIAQIGQAVFSWYFREILESTGYSTGIYKEIWQEHYSTALHSLYLSLSDLQERLH